MELELKIGGVEVEVKIEGVRGAVTLLGVSALAAAVVKELRTPPAVRTWHGTLLGVLPYDLRPPTVERLRATLWNRATRNVMVPTVFGVGWTVNFAALAEGCGCLPAAGDEAAPTTVAAPPAPAR